MAIEEQLDKLIYELQALRGSINKLMHSQTGPDRLAGLADEYADDGGAAEEAEEQEVAEKKAPAKKAPAKKAAEKKAAEKKAPAKKAPAKKGAGEDVEAAKVQLRKLLGQLDGPDAVALLGKFNAVNISSLDPEDYDAVAKRAQELIAGD